MSGRGLGHTGGTVDKLESIPGYRIDLSIQEFKQVLREVGTSIIGQTGLLAPADKKLYALRDVTATIESIPLICASIMSKKLAEGSNALVLDVKSGDGAFMKDRAKAKALATSMVAIGTRAGVRTEAFLTDMDAPLGRTVGNALEIAECVDTLKGRGPDDLTSVVTRLAARMTALAGLETTANAALARATAALSSGRALEVFARMIERQGGDPRIVDDYGLMPVAPDREPLTAWADGVVTRVLAGSIGRATHALGAGRTTVGEPVDHAVGLRMLVARGDRVRQGQPLLELHHRGGHGLDAARTLCREAIHIDPAGQPLPAADRILGEVR
jgi:pyrimidine-nucleoside phosphorylase